MSIQYEYKNKGLYQIIQHRPLISSETAAISTLAAKLFSSFPWLVQPDVVDEYLAGTACYRHVAFIAQT